VDGRFTHEEQSGRGLVIDDAQGRLQPPWVSTDEEMR
jgi:hypothetical protein